MEQQEPDRVIAYHAKMQAIYNNTAAAIFKQQYFPADPFHGELINAAFLEIAELVNVFKAAKALEDECKAPFVHNLIYYRGKHKTPMVRVNPLWLNTLHRHKYHICEYIHACLFENQEAVEIQLQLIFDIKDSQMGEYLCQAEEALMTVEVEVVNEGCV